MTEKQLPKGIRNNNPGNIESGKDHWQGLVGTDGRFAKFKEPKWGIRAIAKVLINYQRMHKLDTIEEIISRWAPPSDNNPTDSYINVVASHVGVDPHEKVDVTNPDILLPMIRKIIAVENGQQPFSDNEIIDGMALAGIDVAKPVKPLTQSRTMKGVGISTVGAVLDIVLSNQELVLALATMVNPTLALAVPKVLTLVGIAYAAYARYDDYKSGVK